MLRVASPGAGRRARRFHGPRQASVDGSFAVTPAAPPDLWFASAFRRTSRCRRRSSRRARSAALAGTPGRAAVARAFFAGKAFARSQASRRFAFPVSPAFRSRSASLSAGSRRSVPLRLWRCAPGLLCACSLCTPFGGALARCRLRPAAGLRAHRSLAAVKRLGSASGRQACGSRPSRLHCRAVRLCPSAAAGSACAPAASPALCFASAFSGMFLAGAASPRRWPAAGSSPAGASLARARFTAVAGVPLVVRPSLVPLRCGRLVTFPSLWQGSAAR